MVVVVEVLGLLTCAWFSLSYFLNLKQVRGVWRHVTYKSLKIGLYQFRVGGNFIFTENETTVESRFLEPPRETKIGSRNREFEKSKVALNRVWKGFCVIRDSAEIERVIREHKENPAVIREFYIGCDAGFSLSVVRDS